MKLTKEWYKSRTIIVLLPMVLYYVAKFTGLDIPETEMTTILESGTTMALTIIAIRGRFKARKELR